GTSLLTLPGEKGQGTFIIADERPLYVGATGFEPSPHPSVPLQFPQCCCVLRPATPRSRKPKRATHPPSEHVRRRHSPPNRNAEGRSQPCCPAAFESCPIVATPLQRCLWVMSDVTRILSAIEHGDPSASDQLLPLVYDECKRPVDCVLLEEGRGASWT